MAITRDDAEYPFDSGYFLYPDTSTGYNDSLVLEEGEGEVGRLPLLFPPPLLPGGVCAVHLHEPL